MLFRSTLDKEALWGNRPALALHTNGQTGTLLGYVVLCCVARYGIIDWAGRDWTGPACLGFAGFCWTGCWVFGRNGLGRAGLGWTGLEGERVCVLCVH